MRSEENRKFQLSRKKRNSKKIPTKKLKGTRKDEYGFQIQSSFERGSASSPIVESMVIEEGQQP